MQINGYLIVNIIGILANPYILEFLNPLSVTAARFGAFVIWVCIRQLRQLPHLWHKAPIGSAYRGELWLGGNLTRLAVGAAPHLQLTA